MDEAEKKNVVDDIGNVNTVWTFKKDLSYAKFSHSKLLVENTGGLRFHKTRLSDEQDRLRISIDLNRRRFHEYVRTIRVLEELLRINLEKQMQLRVSIEFLKSGTKEEEKKVMITQRLPDELADLLDRRFMESLALVGVGIQIP